MAPRRLPPAHEERRVAFRWGRRRVQGREGDTVASALLAAGHTILSRSIKYHRPRSFLCGVGRCANCLVTIDGRPSLRACMVPLREGMRVEGQNAWPSTRWDLLAGSDLAMRGGFDAQRSFTRPAVLVPLYYEVVRRMAGLGKAPRDASPARTAPVPRESAPLVVVGAGPAGLAAARAAAQHGVAVRLLDERPWPGGRLALEEGTLRGGPFDGQVPSAALGALLADLRALGAAPRLLTTVAGLYAHRTLAVQGPARLAEVRCDAVVLAPGASESLPLLGDNDRPGVMALSGAAVLLRRHGLVPGHHVVIAGADARALDLGRGLQRAGAHVTLVDPDPPRDAGFAIVRGAVERTRGARWVRGVVVRGPGGERLALPCDLLAYAGPLRPAVELAQQAGCALRDLGAVLAAAPGKGPEGVWVAGDVAGPGSIEAALASGEAAGLEAARALGHKVDEARLAAARRAAGQEEP